MPLRCRRAPACGAPAIALITALALCGCDREERDYRALAAAAALDPTNPQSTLLAGGIGVRTGFSNSDEESAYAVAEGKRLYRWYNCNGCHANGGGGSGPALMDDAWIYGSAPSNVVATILQGRPNGMPAFGGKIPDPQVMQIAAYVRSMSGLLPKDVAPGRTDHLRAKEPESSTARLAPKEAASPPSARARR